MNFTLILIIIIIIETVFCYFGIRKIIKLNDELDISKEVISKKDGQILALKTQCDNMYLQLKEKEEYNEKVNSCDNISDAADKLSVNKPKRRKTKTSSSSDT